MTFSEDKDRFVNIATHNFSRPLLLEARWSFVKHDENETTKMHRLSTPGEKDGRCVGDAAFWTHPTVAASSSSVRKSHEEAGARMKDWPALFTVVSMAVSVSVAAGVEAGSAVAAAQERALLEVVLFETTENGKYRTYTYELYGQFSGAGAKLSAEGDIVQERSSDECVVAGCVVNLWLLLSWSLTSLPTEFKRSRSLPPWRRPRALGRAARVKVGFGASHCRPAAINGKMPSEDSPVSTELVS
uniref:Uncharacterized protein n=1 Tax=Strigamia maritima TaxID=126957 RepID=T1IXE2_STRMM